VTVREDSQTHGSGILNLALHGAYTFIEDKDAKQIHALIPRLKEHVYRAGSWLAETELRSASYRLSGVKPSDALRFDHDKNLLVWYRHRPDNRAPYATLKLPYPKSVRSLRLAEVPLEFFSHREDLVEPKRTQQIATLQVLTYEIDNENKLALKAETGEDHHWEPAFTGNHINLHVFASEDHYYRPSNAQEDFNQCVALLGANLSLHTRFLPLRGVEQSSLRDCGFAPEETEVLALRTLRMARLGRLIVQKGDANLAWHGNDALDGDPAGCGSVVGCLKTH
jgi:hypothetical protein